jgi:hypothetical protein
MKCKYTHEDRGYIKSHTAAEIAEHYGMSISNVYHGCAAHNVPFLRKGDRLTAQFQQLKEYMQKHTVKDTAKYFDISVDMLYGWVKRNSIIYEATGKHSAADIAVRVNKIGVAGVAREEGVTCQYIYQVLKRAGYALQYVKK